MVKKREWSSRSFSYRIRRKEENMDISTQMINDLRARSGAGIMDCRKALVSCDGDIDKALQVLKEKGLLKAAKNSDRPTGAGLIERYIDTAGHIGAMVEVNCETDFVARSDEFKELAHCLAMHVAAQDPLYLSGKDMPEDEYNNPINVCLLLQPYIKDPAKTVNDVIVETIGRVGENINVSHFVRYEIGDAKRIPVKERPEGLVECYIDTAGHIGAMVEVNCETDFVARTDEFKELAHCLAMHVAALAPRYVSEAGIPKTAGINLQEACLLLQPYIKDPAKTVNDVIVETIGRVGENIKFSRLVRFEIGQLPRWAGMWPEVA
jgi:elongation factor Ts